MNTRLKLAFVHVPKTGGMSIGRALGVSGHNPASYFRVNYPGYTVFAVLRGRLERVRSSQFYHERKRDSIEFFDDSLRIQSLPIDFWLDESCDHYLRFEHLQKDFDKMMDELGHDRIELEHLNVSQ